MCISRQKGVRRGTLAARLRLIDARECVFRKRRTFFFQFFFAVSRPGRYPGANLWVLYYSAALLQYFRNNQFLTGSLLVFYALLVRLPAWWVPAGELNGRDPGAGLWGRAYLRLGQDSPTVNVLLATGVVIAVALLTNYLVMLHRMSKEPTQLPGLFVILLWSVSPALVGLHSIQPASFFLLLAVGSVFDLYQARSHSLAAFNAGLWLGIAVLFNTYFFIFIILLVGGGFSLGRVRPRMIPQIVIGALLPAFLLGSWFYFRGAYADFLVVQRPDFFGFRPGEEAYWNLGGLAYLVTALSFVLFRQFANVKMLVISGRKKVNLLYVWMLIALIALLCHSTFDFSAAQLLVVPLGALLSMSFARGRARTGEAAHLLMLVIALLLNVYPILVQ